MSLPNPRSKFDIKFAIVQASYWVGHATEYGIVYWWVELGRWTQEFEDAYLFDTRSAAEQRLAEENRISEEAQINSIVPVKLYRD
ncbi:hypothetical protein [Microcoleus sp. POL10_C6]|uniref:hypothetical protein n=1 Tax=Microcoleus sp. POL10_C6 TaxID=2818852 RepID=UPI002FD6166D